MLDVSHRSTSAAPSQFNARPNSLPHSRLQSEYTKQSDNNGTKAIQRSNDPRVVENISTTRVGEDTRVVDSNNTATAIENKSTRVISENTAAAVARNNNTINTGISDTTQEFSSERKVVLEDPKTEYHRPSLRRKKENRPIFNTNIDKEHINRDRSVTATKQVSKSTYCIDINNFNTRTSSSASNKLATNLQRYSEANSAGTDSLSTRITVANCGKFEIINYCGKSESDTPRDRSETIIFRPGHSGPPSTGSVESCGDQGDRPSRGRAAKRDTSSREYWQRIRSLSRESKNRQE